MGLLAAGQQLESKKRVAGGGGCTGRRTTSMVAVSDQKMKNELREVLHFAGGGKG